MSLEADYLGAFEEHSPDDIRAALAAGASPTALIKGKRTYTVIFAISTADNTELNCRSAMSRTNIWRPGGETSEHPFNPPVSRKVMCGNPVARSTKCS
jgi:hypothetical protein